MEQYQLSIGPVGSEPDSGAMYYTTDTTYTFTDLEPDTRYSVWVRKACRYTTAGYDTIVWSEWSSPVGFLALSANEVEADGVRLIGQNGYILVQGAKGREVRVYDMLGREVGGRWSVDGGQWSFAVSTAGVYMVRVGDHPARRVVVW